MLSLHYAYRDSPGIYNTVIRYREWKCSKIERRPVIEKTKSEDAANATNASD